MQIKLKKEELSYNLIFFLTFTYNFIIFSRNVFSLNEIFSGIFLIICLIISILNLKIGKEFKIYLILILFFIVNFIVRLNINYHILFVYLVIYLSKYTETKIYGLKFYKYFGLIFLTVQGSLFRFEGRVVNSMIDPNYSGYLYFIYYIFLDRINTKFKWYIFLLGILTFSRNFILAFSVYNLVKINLISKVLIKIKLNTFLRLFGVGSILMLLTGNFYLFYFDKLYQGNYYLTSWRRLFNIVDYSNYYRFLANQKIFEFLKTSKSLFGTEFAWYKENIFLNSPHNLYGVLIINYGIIFTIIFLILVNKYLKIKQENLCVIASLMMYFLFLGYGILGFQLLLTYFILNMKSIEVRHAS